MSNFGQLAWAVTCQGFSKEEVLDTVLTLLLAGKLTTADAPRLNRCGRVPASRNLCARWTWFHIHRCAFWLVCLKNRGPWFRWGLCPIYQGHLVFQQATYAHIHKQADMVVRAALTFCSASVS